MNEKLTSFGTVWDALEDRAKNHHDQLIPVHDIRFHALHHVQIGSQQFPLKTTAARQIAHRLGVPFQYLQKCPDDLQARNLNAWLNSEPNPELFFRFEGQRIRAIMTPRYQPFDHLELLNQLVKIGMRPETPVQVVMDDSLLLLNLPEANAAFSVKGNDRILPGLSIRNSEVGLSSLAISAYLYRLVCCNGLISQEKIHAHAFRHTSTRIVEQLPEVLASTRNYTAQLKRQLTLSLESPVEDPPETLAMFNRQFQLNPLEQEAVEWAWPQEAGDTLFHIIQTYTKGSQYEKLTAQNAYRLQKTGGQLLNMVRHDQDIAYAA